MIINCLAGRFGEAAAEDHIVAAEKANAMKNLFEEALWSRPN